MCVLQVHPVDRVKAPRAAAPVVRPSECPPASTNNQPPIPCAARDRVSIGGVGKWAGSPGADHCREMEGHSEGPRSSADPRHGGSASRSPVEGGLHRFASKNADPLKAVQDSAGDSLEQRAPVSGSTNCDS